MNSKLLLFISLLSIFGIQSGDEIVRLLCDYGVVHYGDFILHSGKQSSVYIDMRILFAHMDLLQTVAHHALNLVHDISYDSICGVPYGALPLATSMCLISNTPLLMLRKTVKTYGTQQLIEGVWKPGDRVLVVEDVITTGQSILEAIRMLESQGLIIAAVFVIIDRKEGGVELLQSQGYQVHGLVALHELVMQE